jgi:RNA polymerase sigma factor (sigma-70 family)
MTTQLFTQNMIAWYNEGRTIAQTRFYDTYRNEVMLAVQTSLPNLSDKQDLVNDIFFKFFKMKLTFETVKQMENYLKRVIYTKCRDFKEVRQTPVVNKEKTQEYFQKLEDRSIRLAEIRMAARALHDKAFQILTPQCREVFILHYVRDIPDLEIAKLLNISVRTVERHLYIARAELKKEFKNDEGLKNMIRFLLPILWSQLGF